MTRSTYALTTAAILFAVSHASAGMVELEFTSDDVTGKFIIDTNSATFTIDSLIVQGNAFIPAVFPVPTTTSITITDNASGADEIVFQIIGGTIGGFPYDPIDLRFEPMATLFNSTLVTQLDSLNLTVLGSGTLLLTDPEDSINSLFYEDIVVTTTSSTTIPVPGALLLGLVGLAALSTRRR